MEEEEVGEGRSLPHRRGEGMGERGRERQREGRRGDGGYAEQTVTRATRMQRRRHCSCRPSSLCPLLGRPCSGYDDCARVTAVDALTLPRAMAGDGRAEEAGGAGTDERRTSSTAGARGRGRGDQVEALTGAGQQRLSLSHWWWIQRRRVGAERKEERGGRTQQRRGPFCCVVDTTSPRAQQPPLI